MSVIQLKRVFDKKSVDDGYRVLVDRWWPLGVRKEALGLDYWAKELAPSDALYEEYHHDPRLWNAFQLKLKRELECAAAQKTLDRLAERAKTQTVTLVYASREPVKNNAAVVKAILDAYER